MKTTALLLLTMGLSPVYAQQVTDCPGYQDQEGVEIVFNTSKYSTSFNMITPSIKDPYGTVAYEMLVGKKGKVFNTTHIPEHNWYYHHVLVQDCQTVYLKSLSNTFDKVSNVFAGYSLVETTPKAVENMWVANMQSDPMTDKKHCTVTYKASASSPFFYFNELSQLSILVLGGDFPGRDVTMRVDKNKAISGDEGIRGANAQLLVQQINAGGKILLVSAYKWPYDYPVIKEFDLTGIIEKLKSCKTQLK